MITKSTSKNTVNFYSNGEWKSQRVGKQMRARGCSLCSCINWTPKVVFEIGVGPANSCRSKQFWGRSECHLFEPVPSFHEVLEEEASSFENVHVHNVAIYKEERIVTFVENGGLSFIEGIDSPLVQSYTAKRRQEHNPSLFPRIKVQAKTIKSYDKGNIDVLLMDMEGSEWYVLESLVSRPNFIAIETIVGRYKNSHMAEIENWMASNDYIVLVRSRDEQDSFYVKRFISLL